MGFKGINVRQTGDRIVFRESLKDSSGIPVTGGASWLRIFELENDGTLNEYDFNNNSFVNGMLTTSTASGIHQSTNNGIYPTGIWTYVLTPVTGFTTGNIYIYSFNNTLATPPTIEREFQYGSQEGDLIVTSGGAGSGYIQSDIINIASNSTAASLLSLMYQTFENGTAQAGTSTSITLRSGASSITDYYKDQVVMITSGTGAVQTNRITAYNGSSKIATVETTWATTPGATSTYVILGRVG